MSEGKFEYRSRESPSNFISISNAHSTQAVKRIVNSSKSSSSAANNTKWFLFSDKQLFSSALKRLITKLTQSQSLGELPRMERGQQTINGTQFRNEKTHFERQFEYSQSIHAYQRASSFRCFSFSHRSRSHFSLLFSPSFHCLLFWSSCCRCCVSLELKSSFASNFHEKFVFMLFEIGPGWCAFSHKCEHFVARLRSTYVQLPILCQRATHYRVRTAALLQLSS